MTVFEDDTPFARSTGECEVKGRNIVCLRTRKVVVEGVVMSTDFKKALEERGAKDGKISLTVVDCNGRSFAIVIATKFAY